jgi:hypothetical protein
MDDDVTLVTTLKWGDDVRIGMRALYKGMEGQHWGYLRWIEVYSDGSEVWNVIEVGGAITIDAVSNRFELIPSGEKRDFSLSPVREPEEKLKVDLHEEDIYKMLLEAFDLKKAWAATRNRRSHKALNAIGTLLSQGTKQHAKIEAAYVAMLKNWGKDDEQHKHIALETAQEMTQLRRE